MSGGEDIHRMLIDHQHSNPMPISSGPLVVSDQSVPRNVGQIPLFPKEDTQTGNSGQTPESIMIRSQKLQDDLQELGEKIKHHEDNIRYLKNLMTKSDELIIDMQVAIGKHSTSSFSKGVNEEPVSVESEEGTLQRIMKCENSAAAILCKFKCDSEAQVSDHSLIKDVLGFVATLGKVDDANLSRILSEYLGLETMLGVVCKTYEGVKALEGYDVDGSINKSFGVLAVAALAGWHLEKRFLVFCLETLRPYTGAVKADDPQRRLDIPKPRLASGETPPGFLGFAVNMVAIDSSNLYFISKNGYSLRETLFYNLFSDLQVYRSREEMLKALSYIPHGAISLDGGVIRNPGTFSFGHDRGGIGVKFPSNSKKCDNPSASNSEIEKQMKETKWKKDRAWEDMQREQTLLDHVKFNFELKKKEFVQFIAESSYAAQHPMGRVSTPR